MAEIRNLTRNGETFYPLTAAEAVIDTSGAYIGNYIESPEFVAVWADSEGKILFAIEKDGNVKFGAGVPKQIIEYIYQKIEELSLDEYEDIVTFLGNLINGDKTLQELFNEKVDKVEGKSLIDAEYASGINFIDSVEFGAIFVDNNENILFGVQKNGNFYFGAGVPKQIIDFIYLHKEDILSILETKVDKIEGKSLINSEYAESQYCVESPEWLLACLTPNNRVVWGIKQNGKIYDSNEQERVQSIVDNLSLSGEAGKSFVPSDYNAGLFKLDINSKSGYLGMNWANSPELNDITKSCSVTTVRTNMNSWTNAAHDISDPTERLAYLETAYDSRYYDICSGGFEIMAGYSPFDWRSNPVTNTLSFEDYISYELDAITMLCDRYKEGFEIDNVPCVIRFIELINEFDWNCIGLVNGSDQLSNARYNWCWSGPGTNIYDYSLGISRTFYFYKQVYLRLKAGYYKNGMFVDPVRPDIKIVLGGLAEPTSQVLVDLCSIDNDPDGYRFWDFIDIYNYHSYEGVNALYNQQKDIYNLIRGCSGGKTIFMNKPVFISEYGDSVYNTTYENQAIRLALKSIVLLASGITSLFYHALRTREEDIRDGAYQTTESYWGIIHNGTQNSIISFLQNNGAEKAIGGGDALSYVKITRSTDVRMLVANSTIVNQLKSNGLLIKGAGYTITKVSLIDNAVVNYDPQTETDIYTTSTVFPQEGGSLIIPKESFEDVAVNYVVKVYVSGVDVSDTWDGLQPKLAYNSLLYFNSLLGENPYNINLCKEDTIYIAAWKDNNEQSVHAIWPVGSSVNIKISTSGRTPEVYNYLGELISIEDNTILIDKMVYVLRAGILTYKII